MITPHEDISKRAREIWEREGRPEGRDMEHWLQAETELQKESPRDQAGVIVASSDSAAQPSSSLRMEEGNRKRNGRRGR